MVFLEKSKLTKECKEEFSVSYKMGMCANNNLRSANVAKLQKIGIRYSDILLHEKMLHTVVSHRL